MQEMRVGRIGISIAIPFRFTKARNGARFRPRKKRIVKMGILILMGIGLSFVGVSVSIAMRPLPDVEAFHG